MFVVTFHSNYILDKPEARDKPQRRFNSAFLTLSSHASEYFESSQHVADAPSNLKQITVKSLISDSEEQSGPDRLRSSHRALSPVGYLKEGYSD